MAIVGPVNALQLADLRISVPPYATYVLQAPAVTQLVPLNKHPVK
mgnify:CR=1